MKITRLRDKLLLRAIAIGIVVALSSMLAASVVIRQQHLDQSNALLRKTSEIIGDSLADYQNNLLIAARQVASQKNLGSTIWYLGQYAQSDFDRETLFNTYQQLTKDTYKTGRVAKFSRIFIYDSAGKLVSFALFDKSVEQVGFVERNPKPSFRIASLKDGEELNRKTLLTTNFVSGVDFEFGRKIPLQESVHYANIDGLLAIESLVPIMGEAFDPNTGKPGIKQLGFVAVVRLLDQDFVDHIPRLADIKINVFSLQGISSGDIGGYRDPDWGSMPLASTSKNSAIALNEIMVDGSGFYQSRIPLYADKHMVGAIAVLYSKEAVEKSIWEMIRILALIAASSLLFIIPFSWYFATTISLPLTVLSRVFRGVADGKNEALNKEFALLEIAKTRQDELGDLTLSFVAMNDSINQKIQQINEINASLERKIDERTAALVASEQESRTLIENSPDTIARYDRECRRTFVNQAFAELAQGGVSALLGKKPSEIPGGPNSSIYEAKIREVFTTGQNTHFELKWLGKDAKEVVSHIRLTAEHDLSGNIISVLGVGRDITELNDSRAELSRKELAKSRFLAAAGHDLRQPLAAANLFIDALKFTEPSPEQNQIIQRLDQAMATFNGLLESLLNISRLDAGTIKPESGAINVIEIFNWLEECFELMAREKQLGFRLHFPMTAHLIIRSDIGLIRSILMNLVSNAIKYTSKGAVLVSARRRGDKVLFQVWDSGVGIPEEHIKHIFDEFYQINNPQRDRTSGLGLGLSIAKRAISLLGGEITCRSRVGHGSVFEFYLPVDKSQGELTTQSGAEVVLDHSAQLAFARKKHFVVVEDDALVAEALSTSLETMGGKITRFQKAEDALCHADIADADCYIADYMLGSGLNGIQLLNQLSQKLGRPINAVLMTGDTSPAFIREAENCDWPVLHKPVNISRLISELSAQATTSQSPVKG